MKVGIDVSRAFRSEKTGIEWYVFYLAKALATLDDKGEYVFYSDHFQNGEVEQMISSRLRILNWPLKKLWTQGRLSLEMLCNSPDVLIIPASALPLIHPKKTIAVIHDIGFLLHTEYRSRNAIAYLSWSTAFALRNAWKIVTVSEWTKQEIIRHYRIAPEKITVAHIGLSNSYRVAPSKDLIRTTLEKYTIKHPYFLNVGRIDQRKNVKGLIDAFMLFNSTHASHQLVIVGPSGYGAKSSINAIEHAVRMGCRIVTIPWIDENEKRALFAGCAAFVFPSLYEGFGIPVIEAQASSVPVIASHAAALPEIAGSGAHFIDPLSPSILADAMKKVASDTSYATQLVQRGLENIKRFSWEQCAKKIDSLWRENTIC